MWWQCVRAWGASWASESRLWHRHGDMGTLFCGGATSGTQHRISCSFPAYALPRPHAGLRFLLALQQLTRPQLAMANCNQKVRNAAPQQQNWLQLWDTFWELGSAWKKNRRCLKPELLWKALLEKDINAQDKSHLLLQEVIMERFSVKRWESFSTQLWWFLVAV